MAMNRKERRKYNIANLLLAVLVKKCALDTHKNAERMAKALATRAKSMLNSKLTMEDGNIKNYLKQKNFPAERLNEYMEWISFELGTTYEASDLHKRLEIDAELLPGIAVCRERLELTALEEGAPVDSGFYDISINRWWNKSVANVDLNDKRDDGKLESYLLYQTFSAARLWEEVTASEHYVLPGYCRTGLQQILQTKSFDKFVKARGIFFELGTGSPAKTNFILSRLKATRLPHHFVWVDASTPMLEYNVTKIDTRRYSPLRFSVVSTDFEAVDKLLEFLDERWPTDEFHEMRKCYFVLGFTLSNLDEASFIRNYAAACKKGDLLIFPMEFIPDSYAAVEAWADIGASDYGQGLITAYNSPVGLSLVREGLSQIKGRLITAKAQRIRPENDTPCDDCIGRSVLIRYMADFEHLDPGDRTVRKKLEILKTTRYFEKDFRRFVERHGFAFKEEAQVVENVKTFLVEFVGRNTDSQNGDDSI